MHAAVFYLVAIGLQQAPLSYADGLALAKERQTPIALFIGCRCRPIPGFISCWEGEIEGDPMPRIIVGDPVYWLGTMKPYATDAQIKGLLPRRASASSARVSGAPVAQSSVATNADVCTT